MYRQSQALFVLFLQVLGYFIKYSAEDARPPLAFVLSEKSAKLLLFPFVKRDDPAETVVECVLLPDIRLWTCGGLHFNDQFLVLLLLFCGCREAPMDGYPFPGPATPKRNLKKHILTVSEQQLLTLNKLQSKLRAREKEVQELMDKLAAKELEQQGREVLYCNTRCRNPN